MIKLIQVIDDFIYLNGVIKAWAEMPTESVFLCLVPDDEYEIQHIVEKDKITTITFDRLAEYLATEEYDAVMFHSLHQYKYPLVLHVPDDRVVLWATWGYDVYYPALREPAVVPMLLYKPLTQTYLNYRELKTYIYRLLICVKQNKLNVIRALRDWYEYFWGTEVAERQEVRKKALARIDYISAVLGEMEYAIYQKNPYLRAKYFTYHYMGRKAKVAVEEEVIDFPATTRILVGNSTDTSNNHADILWLLRKRGICMPLYMPMAYAEAPKHYKTVIKRVLKFLGLDYYIQDELCDYPTYKALLRSCRVAVFGHMRQQSVGNIRTMLRQGSKVFLYKDGINYRYFKDRGFYIYSIEDDLTQQEIDTPLTPEQIAHNCALLEELSFDDFLASLRDTMDEVKKLRDERRAKTE